MQRGDNGSETKIAPSAATISVLMLIFQEYFAPLLRLQMHLLLFANTKEIKRVLAAKPSERMKVWCPTFCSDKDVVFYGDIAGGHYRTAPLRILLIHST